MVLKAEHHTKLHNMATCFVIPLNGTLRHDLTTVAKINKNETASARHSLALINLPLPSTAINTLFTLKDGIFTARCTSKVRQPI